MSASVVLLNMDYQYINKISVRRALRLMAKGKVTIEAYSDRVVHTINEAIQVPSVLRLIKFIRQLYRRRVHWSKKNVMVRDGYRCVYCGAKRNLDIDHVVPQSRGGRDTFENTVTACRTCNNSKGTLTLREAGLFYQKRSFSPYAPTVAEFLMKYLKAIGVEELLQEVFAKALK